MSGLNGSRPPRKLRVVNATPQVPPPCPETMAWIRQGVGNTLHAQVQIHAANYARLVTANPTGSTSEQVQQRKQEGEVIELFLKGLGAMFLTAPERAAAEAMARFLKSASVPMVLGQGISVDAQAAVEMAEALDAIHLDEGDLAPWDPRVLEARLVALGFPAPIKVLTGP